MTNADKIRVMTDEEMAKERVNMQTCKVDGEDIPGMYEYTTSRGERYASKEQAEKAELKWLQSEVY